MMGIAFLFRRVILLRTISRGGILLYYRAAVRFSGFFPGKQRLRIFQAADMRAVLHHLQDTAEFSLFIPHGDIADINKNFRLIDPKFRGILFARSEFLDDFFYDMDACSRVAVLNIAPDNILAPGKNPMIRIGIKADNLIFIHIRKIDR